MSFNDAKISNEQIQQTGIQSQPDIMSDSAKQNKLAFDALPTLIIQKVNSLIDQLQQQAAAGQIGVTAFEGMTATNVQQALEELHADIGGNYGGIDGAGKVGYTPSEGVDASNVQAAIEAVQANLATYIAKIKAVTGAAEVGNAPIVGMTATNVQQALEELRENIDNIVSGVIPGGSITNDMLQGPVSVDKGGTGATTPQGALAALGAGVRPNLLDNAIFIGGGSQQGGGQLPVNQRGQTSYSALTYGIDRWKLFATGEFVVALNSDYISINLITASVVNMSQFVENYSFFKGKTLTFSAIVRGKGAITVGVSDGSYITRADYDSHEWGLLTATFTLGEDITRLEVVLQSQENFDVKATKVELGSAQTLAYQDEDGAWQLLPQPESDYAAQLLKCQKYLLPLGDVCALGLGAFNNRIWFSVPTPTRMRTTPVLQGDLTLYPPSDAINITNWTVEKLNAANCVTIYADGTGIEINAAYSFKGNGAFLTAEL